MIAYRISMDAVDERWADQVREDFRSTLGAAHADAKKLYVREMWPHIYIDEIDVKTDKARIVAMLNGDPPTYYTRRTWTLGPRGGLVLESNPE